mmetsp:Transcript_11082/g.27175  ORF Transcript_11082/g.27175 Transcript_11082/m.27175 type:complete len:132 (-) Transcript_11082:568-963(-)
MVCPACTTFLTGFLTSFPPREPADLTYKKLSFPPGGEGVERWEEDEAFWARFTCKRTQYRVWMPEAESTPTKKHAQCVSTAVAAFFDRERYGFSGRTNSAYQRGAKKVTGLACSRRRIWGSSSWRGGGSGG